MRQAILKFVLFFILSYAIANVLYEYTHFSGAFNGLCRSSVESVISRLMPKAEISTQDVKTESGKLDPNKMYLVYGNPEVIKREMAEARRTKQQYVKISTFSTQFYFFQLFFVPMAFMVSLFFATPMDNRKKIINGTIAIVLLMFFLLLKTYLYTLQTVHNSHIGIYELSQEGANRVQWLVTVMTLGFSITMGFVIWLVLGFRVSSFIPYFSQLFKKLEQ